MYKVLGMLAEKSNTANDIYYLQQTYKSHDIKSQKKITFFPPLLHFMEQSCSNFSLPSLSLSLELFLESSPTVIFNS